MYGAGHAPSPFRHGQFADAKVRRPAGTWNLNRFLPPARAAQQYKSELSNSLQAASTPCLVATDLGYLGRQSQFGLQDMNSGSPGLKVLCSRTLCSAPSPAGLVRAAAYRHTQDELNAEQTPHLPGVHRDSLAAAGVA